MDIKTDERLKQLFVLSQQGDKRAYSEFLTEVAEVLKGFLQKRIRNEDHVEEVLQETLIAIHKALHTFEMDRLLGPWLYAICRHRMIDFFRAYGRRNEVETLMPELEETLDPSTLKCDSDQTVRVRELLERLPSKQKTVIEFLKIRNFTVKETAVMLKMTESAVKVTAFRGYQKIRKGLEPN